MTVKMTKSIVNQDWGELWAEQYIVRMKVAVYRAHLGIQLKAADTRKDSARVVEAMPINFDGTSVRKEHREGIGQKSLFRISEIPRILVPDFE
jgi:hypothetical protein